MRILTVMAILASILLFFQNCADTVRNPLIFADEVSSSTACSGRSCAGSGELLWLSIQDFDPYKVDYDVSINLNYFIVSGECGTSDFPGHFFNYTLREGFGSQQVIANGVAENRCDLGQFQVPIQLNIALPQRDQLYQLSLDLIGVDASGIEYTNRNFFNQGSIGVIFESGN